ncbi:MAG: hypothetical protein HY814_12895, partial [Candidatus Riflebacteria bacterium]|nr:hypothetical protein [Candidatus Riflebacteria bacterium]
MRSLKWQLPLYVALALVVLWIASPLICRTASTPARPAEGPPSYDGLNISTVVNATNISVVQCGDGGSARVDIGCVNLG